LCIIFLVNLYFLQKIDLKILFNIKYLYTQVDCIKKSTLPYKMTERTVTFKGTDNKKFNYDIPYSIELVINLFPKIEEHLKLTPGASITLFVTLPTGKQYIYKPSDTIDSFIEKSKGGFVTIFVKAKPQPAQQPQQAQAQEVVEHRRLPVLKPGEELHMVNTGNPEDIVIEGKKAGSTGGWVNIELGSGAAVQIPPDHPLLKGRKIGIQEIQTQSGQPFRHGNVFRLELLDK
jgi:hypothetical protein